MTIHSINKMFEAEFGFQFDYDLNGKEYIIQIVIPNTDSNYKIPYVLVLPKQMKENSILAVETNNLETENQDELLSNGLLTAYNLITNLKEYDNPVLVPIIPSVKGGIPYYQQLSRECFSVSKDDPYYRIDLQVLNIITEVKHKLNVQEKIFLNGYSASGVFAQRFALLHPEIIDTLCVGGASGSIPIPITELGYPLGIGDYFSVAEKNFDLHSYNQIKFRYYVGSLEDKRKSYERYDEDGNYASMHDMSYLDRSVPNTIGRKQRDMFGQNIFERTKKLINLMNQMGVDINQEIFENRAHNDYDGINVGVNELGAQFINDTYKETIDQVKRI